MSDSIQIILITIFIIVNLVNSTPLPPQSNYIKENCTAEDGLEPQTDGQCRDGWAITTDGCCQQNCQEFGYEYPLRDRSCDEGFIFDPVSDCCKAPVICGIGMEKGKGRACENCPPGTYRDKESMQICRKCLNCEDLLFRNVTQQCTSTSPAVCGACLHGYVPDEELIGPEEMKNTQRCLKGTTISPNPDLRSSAGQWHLGPGVIIAIVLAVLVVSGIFVGCISCQFHRNFYKKNEKKTTEEVSLVHEREERKGSTTSQSNSCNLKDSHEDSGIDSKHSSSPTLNMLNEQQSESLRCSMKKQTGDEQATCVLNGRNTERDTMRLQEEVNQRGPCNHLVASNNTEASQQGSEGLLTRHGGNLQRDVAAGVVRRSEVNRSGGVMKVEVGGHTAKVNFQCNLEANIPVTPLICQQDIVTCTSSETLSYPLQEVGQQISENGEDLSMTVKQPFEENLTATTNDEFTTVAQQESGCDETRSTFRALLEDTAMQCASNTQSRSNTGLGMPVEQQSAERPRRLEIHCCQKSASFGSKHSNQGHTQHASTSVLQREAQSSLEITDGAFEEGNKCAS